MAAEMDYSKFTRQQKLASFLVVIGPEAAADVLNQFEDVQIETLCREMAKITLISESMQKQVIEEFSTLVAHSAASALGGMGYAQRTLGIAKGDRRATLMLDRLGQATSSNVVATEIADMEARQIYNLIRYEQPQTIAFILSYLETDKSAEVFNMISQEQREEVLDRLGTIESTSVELASKIARNLGGRLDTKARPPLNRSGGVRAVADILNLLDKDTSKTLLSRLEERNAKLVAAIRKKLFGFEDLNRLQPADLQRVLREVESGSLGIAMKSASEGLRQKFYGAISKRAAESLKEEVEMLGPVRLKDVEVAQDAIIQVVRRLEEENQISLDSDGDQAVVS